MRRYLLALPLLVLAFAFAACGSDDSASSDESAATATPTEAATEAPTETATEDSSSSGKGGEVKVTGKLGEKPTIKSPGGTAPDKLVIKDIKKGTGKTAKAGDTVS